MTTALKNVSAAVCAALLAACGGSSGNAALSKTFTYGAATAPNSNESAAASSAQSNLSTTTSFSSSPSANNGYAIVGFADAMAGLALGTAVFGEAPGGLLTRGALYAATDVSACSTVVGNTVTFTNCSQSASGFSFTFSGTVTASAGVVSWNVTGNFSVSSSSGSASFTMHEAGNIVVTSTKVTGDFASEFGGSASANGQSVRFGLATAVPLDVTYQTSPTTCVTGGSVEVKRVWTQTPNGASGGVYKDAGVKITWTGCSTVQVAHSQ